METTTEKEPSEVITPDTENATYFLPDEAPASNTNYERLQLLNRNTWVDRREENKEVKHRQGNLALYDALSSQLELTDYQKSRGRTIIDRLKLGEWGIPTELVAFGVCAVVANDDVPTGTRYWPTAHHTDKLFERIGDDLEYSSKQQLRVITKLKAGIDT